LAWYRPHWSLPVWTRSQTAFIH